MARATIPRDCEVAHPQAQTIKTWSDATGLVLANSGTAAVTSIDAQSPFGASRLRVDAPVGNTYFEVGFAPSIAKFQGAVAFRIWFSDWRACLQLQLFAGTAGYANLMQKTFNVQNSNLNNRNGPITIFLNPEDTSTNTFVQGSDTLAAVKFRAFTRSGYANTMWVESFYVPNRMRPKLLLTFDDAYVRWIDLLLPELASRGLKATFGVNTGDVGTNHALFIDVPDLLAIQTAGHEVYAHNITNTAYGTQTAAQYAADYATALAQLRAWGIRTTGDYHPFVQGAHDQELITALAGKGVRMMRGVDSNKLNGGAAGVRDNLSSLKIVSHSATGGANLATQKSKLDQAIQYGMTYVAMLHEPVTSGATGIQYLVSDLNAFLDYAVLKQRQGLLDIVTPTQWLRQLNVGREFG